MRLADALDIIRERLVTNTAAPQTLRVVDLYRRKAAAADAIVPSLMKTLTMLMRTPETNGDSSVYNDLALLEEQLQRSAAISQAEREREENRPMPKLKKDYKAEREKEKATKK